MTPFPIRKGGAAVCVLAVLLSPLTATGAVAARPLPGIPLQFERLNETGDFIARVRGCSVELSATFTKLHLATPRTAASDPNSSRDITMEFCEASPNSSLQPAAGSGAQVNYLTGNDPSKWRVGLPLFTRIKAREVYPGIDIEYYGNEKQLEYDLIVAPGASPAAVAFAVVGADHICVNAEGDLILRVGDEEISHHKPISYQVVNGVRRHVASSYVLSGSRISFAVGAYDRSLPLVIDPVLSFSTYFGGLETDNIMDVATDSQGNIYITGSTASSWLATGGAAQPFFAGATAAGAGDAFVAKFAPDGSHLVYLTYLGGSGNDGGAGLAVDQQGAVCVTGVTDSTNFPVVAAMKWFISGEQNKYAPLYPSDAFVTKIDPSGSRLVYSTYLGGSADDQGTAITVDSQGYAYVTGFAELGDLQLSSWSQKYAGGSDVFVAKFSPAGKYGYSILIGGGATDRGNGIVVDSQGQATVVGYTSSSTFPITNAIQPRIAGKLDAFVTTISRDGTYLIRSTYLGGSGTDVAYKVAIDSADNIYLTGSQSGDGFPITPGNLNPGGVYASGSRGGVWANASSGLDQLQIHSLAISASNPSVIYAGTRHGVARSTDAGATWQTLLAATSTVRSLAVDPSNPLIVYATENFIWKSVDGGNTWSSTNNVNLPVDGPVYKLITDPAQPEVLYAGLYTGVYRSTNAASSWSRSSSGVSTSIVDIAASPSNPSTLYAATAIGVFRSTNAAKSWQKASGGLGNKNVRRVAIDPTDELSVFAGTSTGLWKTSNGGTNWISVPFAYAVTNTLTTKASVAALAIDPINPLIVYAGTTKGLFKTENGGLDWVSLAQGYSTTNGLVVTNGLAVSNVLSLALSPQNPDLVYAGTQGPSPIGSSDAFLVRLTPSFMAVGLGGKSVDQGWDLGVDAKGNSYIVGTTASLTFPTNAIVDPMSGKNRGGYDAFLAAVAADGSSLLYSGYIGGRGTDRANAVVIDAAGNVVMAGYTTSLNFPLRNAYSRARLGASDGFIMRFSSE